MGDVPPYAHTDSRLSSPHLWKHGDIMENFKSWEDVRLTRERIAPAIHLTPVLTSRTLDREAGTQLFFKCENLQRTGSFKIRGAANLVYSLSTEEAARG